MKPKEKKNPTLLSLQPQAHFINLTAPGGGLRSDSLGPLFADLLSLPSG